METSTRARAKPFIKVPQDMILPGRISPRAFSLYSVLLMYARQRDFCWPGQEKLAELIGVSRRTVVRLLKELAKAGILIIDRRGLGRTNLYRLAEVTPMSHPEVTSTSHQEVTPVAHQEVTPMSLPIRDEEDTNEKDSSSGSSAAAVSFSPSQKQEIVEELGKLGLPPSLAIPRVEANPGLALAAIPYFRQRFADPKKREVGTRIGYMRSLFDSPEEKHGFRFDAQMGWLAPETEETAAKSREQRWKEEFLALVEPGKQKLRAEVRACFRSRGSAIADLPDDDPVFLRYCAEHLGRRREYERRETSFDAAIPYWNGRTEEEREDIRETVRREEPLLAADGPDGVTFMRSCLAESERLRKALESP